MEIKKTDINKLEAISDALYKRLENCDICPRNCNVNRLKGLSGYCGTAKDILVYSAFLHYGEEPAISGEDGSGTIFFSGCSLKCVYCQNYKFSHSSEGKKVTEQELAKIMLRLQKKGANNINLVTPTHFLPQILKSLIFAFKEGLGIPIVYNTSGYEKKVIISQIKGFVDIYLADMKYIEEASAEEYSNAPDYPIFNQESVLEMVKQKKAAWNNNLLKKGVVIRHLILPGHIKESQILLSWIKNNIPRTLVSVMFQYQPYFKAKGYKRINRVITAQEYREIKKTTDTLNLEGWIQDFTSEETLAGPYFEQNIGNFLRTS